MELEKYVIKMNLSPINIINDLATETFQQKKTALKDKIKDKRGLAAKICGVDERRR